MAAKKKTAPSSSDDWFKEGRKLEKAADAYQSNRQMGSLENQHQGHAGAAARYREAAAAYRKARDKSSAENAEYYAEGHEKTARYLAKRLRVKRARRGSKVRRFSPSLRKRVLSGPKFLRSKPRD